MSTLAKQYSGSIQWHEPDDAICCSYLSARETPKMMLRLHFRANNLPVHFVEALVPPESFVFPLLFSFTANRRAPRMSKRSVSWRLPRWWSVGKRRNASSRTSLMLNKSCEQGGAAAAAPKGAQYVDTDTPAEELGD